jgi:hypothetical protein
MVYHVYRLFRPAPETTQEFICNVACSLAPSDLIAPPSGEKQLVAAFADLQKNKKVRKAIAMFTLCTMC